MGEERDDAPGVGGGAAVVVAFLPEAADVVCYVAGEAFFWEASEGVGLAGGELGVAGRKGGILRGQRGGGLLP